MFRKMARFKQQLEESECIEILKREKRGVLSLIGDGGYPYGVPLNHFYNEKSGKQVLLLKTIKQGFLLIWSTKII